MTRRSENVRSMNKSICQLELKIVLNCVKCWSHFRSMALFLVLIAVMSGPHNSY